MDSDEQDTVLIDSSYALRTKRLLKIIHDIRAQGYLPCQIRRNPRPYLYRIIGDRVKSTYLELPSLGTSLQARAP